MEQLVSLSLEQQLDPEQQQQQFFSEQFVPLALEQQQRRAEQLFALSLQQFRDPEQQQFLEQQLLSWHEWPWFSPHLLLRAGRT